MPEQFKLHKDKRGKLLFRLKATNGQIFLARQGYKTKPSAKGCTTCRASSAGSANYLATSASSRSEGSSSYPSPRW